MSSHQDQYYYSGPSQIYYYESGSEPPVTRRPRPQSWPLTATTNDVSGYTHTHTSRSSDTVGNPLEVHDAEDLNYLFDYSDPSYSLPSTSSQDPGDGTYATYTDDNVQFHHLMNLPFYPYVEPVYGPSQHQPGYAPYYPIDNPPTQPLFHDAHQHLAQNVPTSQMSEASIASFNSYSPSTQLLSLNPDRLVLDTRAARPAPDRLAPDRANTARTVNINAEAGQHSNSAVEPSSDQKSAAGPSHPPPVSPERKRLLPWSAEEEHPTGRRVVARHDRASSVHSRASGSPRRSRSNSEVHGRGPVIPQERYTTSSISSYNAPDAHPPIAFKLQNPDQIGIQITDILDRTGGFTRLRDRLQAFDMEKKTFTLRVQWPGYEPWSKTIAALDWTKSRAPVTRVKLAEAVATAIRGLFEKYRDKPYDPYYAQWNVGPTGIQLNQVCLVALHHVSKGSWQPQLCLLEHLR